MVSLVFSSDEYLNYAMINRRKWKEQGEVITAQIVDRFEGGLSIPQPHCHNVVDQSFDNMESGHITNEVDRRMVCCKGNFGLSNMELCICCLS
jgi:hypothetical protein